MLLLQYLFLTVMAFFSGRLCSDERRVMMSKCVRHITLGKVLPGDSVHRILYFDNPTDRPLKVRSVQLTPPLVAHDVTQTVAAGGVGEFTLGLADQRSLGPYGGTIKVHFYEDSVAPVEFTVDGFFVPPIEFKPYSEFFVATDLGHSEQATIEIINHQSQPLFISDTEHGSNRFDVNVATLVPGEHYAVTLTLSGIKPGAKLSEPVYLKTGEGEGASMTLTANTWIRERVYTFPERVDMSRLPLSLTKDQKIVDALTQRLMVYRKGSDDFEITVSTDLDNIQIHSERLPEGDRYQLMIRYLPDKTQVGDFSGEVKIQTNDDQIPELCVPIKGCLFARDRRAQQERRDKNNRGRS